MKLLAKHLRFLTLLALPAASSGPVHAATLITFESPYTVAALSTGTTSTIDRPFDGQQGWSRSTSSGVGNIIGTTTSGSYTGGQGLTGNLTGSGTYIGAKAVGPMTSFTFDFRYYAEEMTVGGWNDDDADGLFDQAEAEFMAGTVKIGTTTPVTSFGLRTSGFATRYSTGTSGTAGDWYRMTVTPDFANLQVTLGVHNLTTNSSVSLATSVFTLTGAEFGVDPTTLEGISARVTSSSTNPSVLDNINVIPEPAAALLGCLGLLTLLRRRRA